MAAPKTKRKTNVIYLVLDDIGFSDLGCYGSDVQTPNIDAIAADGLRYNNFSVCPASSPTRASLLTGRDNNTVGMGNIANFVFDDEYPDVKGCIKPEAGTIAEILKMNGFATFAVGKWHVAPLQHETPAGPFTYWPLNKGFDRYYGWLEGETDQYHPQLIYDNHYIREHTGEGYHVSCDLINRSIEFISDEVSVYPDKPFFLYLCFGVAHSPHQVPTEYIERYKGLYSRGWNAMREERFRRQIEMGIVPEGSEIAPKDPGNRAWDELDENRKALYEKFQETYAGFISHCDEQIGRLIAFLKEIGEYDNTILAIISDNGASRDGGTEGVDDFYRTLNGISPTFDDLFALCDDIGGPEVKALYPKGWAEVSNTPFYEYKGTTRGGGVREPLIIHWPEGFPDKGAIRRQSVHVTDLTPTILDIMGIEAPAEIKGVKQLPIAGHSIYQTMIDENAQPPSPVMFFKWANTRALVADGWKAISTHNPGTSFEDDIWELYHISEDFCEAHDVAALYPDKLQELIGLWWQMAESRISLPLKEITPNLMRFVPPDSASNRKHFRYLPGINHIGVSADPPTENASHTITAHIVRDSAEQEGVLVAQGGTTGGYTFYIKDNHLHYVLNNFRTYYTLDSDVELPLGPCTVRFEYKNMEHEIDSTNIKNGPMAQVYGTLSSDCAGWGRLYINDILCADSYMRSVHMGLSLEALDIGRDTMTPVIHYGVDDPEFAFTGTLKEVVFDIL